MDEEERNTERMGAAEKRSGSPANKKQACRRRERRVLRDTEEEDDRTLCFGSKKLLHVLIHKV